MPARNAPTKSLLHISRVDVYRLAEPANAPLVLSEEEFAARSIQIASVPVTDSDFGMKTMTYNDTLQFAGQPVRLRYGVRLVNASGQKATFSNFLLIEPAATVATAPSALSAAVSQDAITLQWTAPARNINGTTPVNLVGYDVYRSESDKQAGKLLNKTPVTDTRFADNFFEFGKNYFYFVRAVSVGSAGIPVESQESNIVDIRPVDTFPPSPPAAITLAAAPNNISIFFAVNPEKDIAGYKIYRSTDPDLDKSLWTLLTPQLLPTNTFQDTKVESGNTYYYYITATDKTGNVSQPSEVVKETAP
jgi:fibronectin type 3 domain-containing protein